MGVGDGGLVTHHLELVDSANPKGFPAVPALILGLQLRSQQGVRIRSLGSLATVLPSPLPCTHSLTSRASQTFPPPPLSLSNCLGHQLLTLGFGLLGGVLSAPHMLEVLCSRLGLCHLLSSPSSLPPALHRVSSAHQDTPLLKA